MFSRNFCLRNVRVKFFNFHKVISTLCFNIKSEKFRESSIFAKWVTKELISRIFFFSVSNFSFFHIVLQWDCQFGSSLALTISWMNGEFSPWRPWLRPPNNVSLDTFEIYLKLILDCDTGKTRKNSSNWFTRYYR